MICLVARPVFATRCHALLDRPKLLQPSPPVGSWMSAPSAPFPSSSRNINKAETRKITRPFTYYYCLHASRQAETANQTSRYARKPNTTCRAETRHYKAADEQAQSCLNERAYHKASLKPHRRAEKVMLSHLAFSVCLL
jgi:hypothetical protein